MTLSLTGIGVAKGIRIGPVHVLERGQPDVVEYCIQPDEVESEIERLQNALQAGQQQLHDIRRRIPDSTSREIAEFIDTHILMLSDSALSEVPVQFIRTHRCNAEWALKMQLDALVSVFDEMDDPYLRTRRDDVIHVVNRVLRILLAQEPSSHESEWSLQGKIIIAEELTPADVVLLQHQGITAFVTESGGPLSHTAIMARSLRIPAIVGVHHARRFLRNDETAILDGGTGVIIAGADAGILESFQRKQQRETRYYTDLERLRDEPAVSRDGTPVSLQANIELPEDIATTCRVNAAGIGLFRTEFLFMNRTAAPDEEEQFEAYRQVVDALPGRTVTIRTIDLGADKHTDLAQEAECPTNPALGLRAIRLCLKDPSLFRPQLRAILRASAFGPVRLMIPMLSNIQEVIQVLHTVRDLQQELRRQDIAFDADMPIGGMIEVPAAAISAPLFARHLDFLSIGTNDLIQYTLAIDRIDEQVNYLYEPCHPSVLQLIFKVIKSARSARIPVSMCGEMASDTRYTRLLLGLGLREFSMQPSAIPEVKNIIRQSDVREYIAHSRRILKCENIDDAHSLLQFMNH